MKRLFGSVVMAMMLAVIVNTVGMPMSTAHAAGDKELSAVQLLNPARGPVFSPLMTPNTWNALGNGLNGITFTFVIDGTEIYAGGLFTDAGGDSNADYVAKWDGDSWSALGSGLNGTVRSIVINGPDIYVGGDFTDAGGDSNADYVAKWDGISWSALGIG